MCDFMKYTILKKLDERYIVIYGRENHHFIIKMSKVEYKYKPSKLVKEIIYKDLIVNI